MTIGETVRKALKELSEAVLNSITLDFKLDDGAVTKPKRAKGYTEKHTKEWLDSVKKPKRARTKKGTYKADDKSTPNVNEAWVGGKAPTRKQLLGLKKKKTKRKTKGKK